VPSPHSRDFGGEGGCWQGNIIIIIIIIVRTCADDRDVELSSERPCGQPREPIRLSRSSRQPHSQCHCRVLLRCQLEQDRGTESGGLKRPALDTPVQPLAHARHSATLPQATGHTHCHMSTATSHKPQATSHKPQDTSHKTQATRHKPQATSHKTQATSKQPQATSKQPQATCHAHIHCHCRVWLRRRGARHTRRKAPQHGARRLVTLRRTRVCSIRSVDVGEYPLASVGRRAVDDVRKGSGDRWGMYHTSIDDTLHVFF
jgi:hypothetical protein